MRCALWGSRLADVQADRGVHVVTGRLRMDGGESPSAWGREISAAQRHPCVFSISVHARSPLPAWCSTTGWAVLAVTTNASTCASMVGHTSAHRTRVSLNAFSLSCLSTDGSGRRSSWSRPFLRVSGIMYCAAGLLTEFFAPEERSRGAFFRSLNAGLRPRQAWTVLAGPTARGGRPLRSGTQPAR